MKWKCRNCGREFEARSSHIDWGSRERVDPKCPGCKSKAVKPVLTN
jgi:DNA-directed RNA polymerase subunit RPC12/RpoP